MLQTSDMRQGVAMGNYAGGAVGKWQQRNNTDCRDSKGGDQGRSTASVGSGGGQRYTYTHDLGIQGMQQNLGLSDDQIIRKINVNDSDTQETRQAIQECIDEGCNIIFTTSWGYMETTAEMAEEYPDVYFSHGTGYLSNGKISPTIGRIYQARYLSGIVAGMNTSSNKIGYVAAMDSSNSEVTGGIDAFALGIYSVNPDAKRYT